MDALKTPQCSMAKRTDRLRVHGDYRDDLQSAYFKVTMSACYFGLNLNLIGSTYNLSFYL